MIQSKLTFKLFFSFFVIFGTFSAGYGQSGQYSPIQWIYTARKIGPLKYEIHLSATLQEPWHTYSQSTPKGGPLPTSIKFAATPLIIMNGPTKEIGDMVQEYDKTFGVEIRYFEGKVDFVQNITLKANVKTNVTGTITYMACTNEQCLPPTTDNIKLAIGG